MSYRRLIGAIAISITVGAAAACGPATEVATVGEPAAAEAPESKTESQPEDTEELLMAAFGQAITWSDGVEVTVGVPTPVNPSEYASGHIYGEAYSLEVSIANNSETPVDSFLMITAASGNQEAERIFDEESQFGTNEQPVLPGRSTKFTVGFSADGPLDLVTVQPGFNHNPGHFEPAS
ncbi:hypothetical protein [Solwaraspora sp. WMMA2101]|uniref:hypothetical protein n=1 Tax=Solwaraspora sp. WMMA2101 TaxID=3404124 RepID=UPI003B93CAD7